MTQYNRFAIYFAPRTGAFADFMSSWLGWDCVAGCVVAHPPVSGLPRSIEEITTAPRKYGFHGTLKPPFRLAEGSTRHQLEEDVATLAATLRPVNGGTLNLLRIGQFLALVSERDVGALARNVVVSLDHHRAPLTAAELERRRAVGLTDHQDALLERWGYPFVMDEFRFHLTLSGMLPEDEIILISNALRGEVEASFPHPFMIEDLCLFGEAADGYFHLIHRYALSG